MAIHLDHIALKLLWVFDKPTHQGWNEPRRNTSIHTFYWVHKGKGTFVTENDTVEVAAGTLAYIPPGQKMRMMADNEFPFHMIMVLFDCIALPYEGKQWGELQAIPSLGFPFLQQFEKPTASEIDNLFLQLNKRFTSDHISSEIEAKFALLSLLSILYQTDEEPKESIKRKHVYEKVKSQLEMFFHMDIKISELAKQHAVSLSYLRKMFVKYAGISPKAYLNQIRNDHAIRLLLHSSASIKEIASECGFSDELYFSTMFKQLNHVSPSLFRKNRAKN